MRELDPLAIGFSCSSAVMVSGVWPRSITMSTSRCAVPCFRNNQAFRCRLGLFGNTPNSYFKGDVLLDSAPYLPLPSFQHSVLKNNGFPHPTPESWYCF